MIVRLTHTARRASVSEADEGVAMDVLNRADLPFPESLPEFQRLFPDDTACAADLEKARWGDGFAWPNCGVVGEPFRIATRPGVLTCRACRRQTGFDRGHGDGARSYAPQRLVLGGLPRRQPDARHVGGAVPAATWLDPLRDGFRHPAQAPRGHGATRSG